jgi:predicted dehydrogenase
MNPHIAVGVIGAGRMSQRAHVPNALAERCDVRAIADPRAETARLVAERFGVPHVYADYRELIARPDIEAVIISVPDQFHAEVGIAAAEAGKHVFIEKPLATNSGDGRAMVAAARKAGVVFSVAFQRRHDPAAEIAKRLVDEWARTGEMGKLRLMFFPGYGGDWIASPYPLISAGDDQKSPERGAPWRLPEWLPSEFHGAFAGFNNGRSHGLDLLLYLFGPATSVLGAWPDWNPGPLIVFDWSGARTTFSHGADERGRWQERLEMHWDNGSLTFSTPPALLRNVPGTVEVYRAKEGKREVYEAPHDWAFRREMAHFLRAIREGVPASPTPEDALRSLVLVEDVFRQAMRMAPPMPASGIEG